MNKDRVINQAAVKVTKTLVDKGKLVEAGFALFRIYVIDKGASDLQVAEMQMAFMAGAEHVFTSILAIMGGGPESSDDDPTEKDMARMGMISDELAGWRELILKKHNKEGTQ